MSWPMFLLFPSHPDIFKSLITNRTMIMAHMSVSSVCSMHFYTAKLVVVGVMGCAHLWRIVLILV